MSLAKSKGWNQAIYRGRYLPSFCAIQKQHAMNFMFMILEFSSKSEDLITMYKLPYMNVEMKCRDANAWKFFEKFQF